MSDVGFWTGAIRLRHGVAFPAPEVLSDSILNQDEHICFPAASLTTFLIAERMHESFSLRISLVPTKAGRINDIPMPCFRVSDFE